MSEHYSTNRSRLFLYSGLFLVFLALVTLPIRIMIQAQLGDFDYYGVGWLFAPVIGTWGLTSIALGIMESSRSRKETLACLLPVFTLIYVGLAFASWMVMNNAMNWFWRLYFGFIFFPFLIGHTAAFFYFTKKEKLARILKNTRTRTYVFIALLAAPLFYTVIFLYLFSLFT
jgi:hypothetical protein